VTFQQNTEQPFMGCAVGDHLINQDVEGTIDFLFKPGIMRVSFDRTLQPTRADHARKFDFPEGDNILAKFFSEARRQGLFAQDGARDNAK